MEGACLHAVRAEIAQPGAQLARGARGEGDREQLAGRNRAGAHLEGDPVGDRPRLARTRTGQDADRPAHGLRGGLLLGVEPAQHDVGIPHAGHLASGLGQFGEWCAPPWGCSHMLTMYTTTWCGFCARLKAQLQREGIDYAEVDIERDESAAELVMSVNGGNQTVPTLVFPNGTALTNPSVAEVKAQLAA